LWKSRVAGCPLCHRPAEAAKSEHEFDRTEGSMNLAELNKVAEAMVAPGRGILAADESSGTIKKRFDAIGVGCTADSRRDYRQPPRLPRAAVPFVRRHVEMHLGRHSL